jgi:starch-binding outer membrane protein, SusD/RagB family
MKNILNNKKIAAKAFLIGLALIATNCKKLTDGYSTDPVNITDPSVISEKYYMSGIEVSLIGVYEADIARMAGMWAGYFSGEQRQYLGQANYIVTAQDFDTEWGTIYTGVMENAKLLKQGAKKQNNAVSIGITQIMEAMVLGTAADLWGDVPYSQISQYPSNTTPKFDTQASVYGVAQTLLDSAITNLGLSGSAAGDFFLAGNKSAWIQVAHTIKARLYLHTRDYTNALSEAGSGISSASGNVMAPHGSAYLQTFNLYYSFLPYDRSGYMAANSYCPNLLDPSKAGSRNNAKTNENGRLNYYYAPYAYWGGLNTSAEYDPNVLVDFDWGTPTSLNGFFGATTSFPIVTFQENALILAEANAKLGNTQPAIDALNSLRQYYTTGAQFGTSTSYVSDPDLGGVQYDDYVAADFAPGGIENQDNVTAATALLREILEERYVTLIGQIEGFNDMRRTGNFLNLPISAGKPTYPKRALYSQVEINTNPNVPTTSVGLFDPVNSFSTTY